MSRELVMWHLETIIGIVNRLADTSRWIRGWNLLVALAGLLAAFLLSDPMMGVAMAPAIVSMWGLDGYYLWQERLFRGLYDRLRTQTTTDLKMSLDPADASWIGSALSRTAAAFHLTMLFLVLMPVLLI